MFEMVGRCGSACMRTCNQAFMGCCHDALIQRTTHQAYMRLDHIVA